MKSKKNDKNIKTNVYLENDFHQLKLLLSKNRIKNKKILLLIDKSLKNKINKELIELFSENNSIFIYKDKSKDKNKNLTTVNKVLVLLNKFKFDNDDYIVSIGDSFLIDIGGVVSSIYYKALNYIILPSTLSSMINYTVFNNYYLNNNDSISIIKTNKKPIFVYSNLTLLNYLNYERYILGIASAIRLSLIKDKKLFQFIEKRKEDIVEKNLSVIHYIINQTIKINKYFYKLMLNNDKSFKTYEFALEYTKIIQKLEHFNYKFDYALAIAINKVLEFNNFDKKDSVYTLLNYFKFDLNYKKDIVKILENNSMNNRKQIILLSRIGKAYIYNYAKK